MKLLVALGAAALSFNAFAADLKVSENISILTINGEKTMSQSGYIPLNEGPQVIAVKYNELFYDNAFVDQEFVRSTVQIVRFNAEGNQQYTISAPMNMDLQEARDFAQSPQFQMSNDNGQQVAHTTWSRNELLTELLARP